ncbi:hypothetical protein CIHUM_08420 [Corynebacterium ihumii]|uniref:Uncharacterized protein n=1 Tax=Corynebacterium ihumii TaxID=1232427 RepID=A0ABY7UEI5_9CORY|nr:hypothetical protein CIHUM_08420 [Corynebacterium ihumii]
MWPVGALRRQPVAPCKGPVRQIQRSADLSYGAITIFLHLGAGYAGEDKTAAQQGFGQGPGIACEGSPSAEKLVQRRRGVEMGLKRRKTPSPGCGLRVEAGTKPISVRSQNRGSGPAGLEADFSPMALFNVKTARKKAPPRAANGIKSAGDRIFARKVPRIPAAIACFKTHFPRNTGVHLAVVTPCAASRTRAAFAHVSAPSRSHVYNGYTAIILYSTKPEKLLVTNLSSPVVDN